MECPKNVMFLFYVYYQKCTFIHMYKFVQMFYLLFGIKKKVNTSNTLFLVFPLRYFHPPVNHKILQSQ